MQRPIRYSKPHLHYLLTLIVETCCVMVLDHPDDRWNLTLITPDIQRWIFVHYGLAHRKYGVMRFVSASGQV